MTAKRTEKGKSQQMTTIKSSENGGVTYRFGVNSRASTRLAPFCLKFRIHQISSTRFFAPIFYFHREKRKDLAEPKRVDKTKIPSKQNVAAEYEK